MELNRYSNFKFVLCGLLLALCVGYFGCPAKNTGDKNKKAQQTSGVTAPSEGETAPSEKQPVTAKQEINEPNKIEQSAKGSADKDANKIDAGAGKEEPNSVNKAENPANNGQRTIDAVLAEFNQTADSKRKIELLESLDDYVSEQDPRVINIVQKAMDDPNVEVERAAISLLRDYKTAEILPAVAKALNSADEETRQEALLPLSGIDDPQVGQLLAQAINDPSADVRSAALDAAGEHEGQINLDVMESGIASKYQDVRESVISSLEIRSDHAAVDILIKGLKDTDPDFRDQVNEALDWLIDEKFETFEQAQEWWSQNKTKFSDDLVRIEDDN